MSYEPTNWKKGDKITSVRLNKIENGIQGNDSEIGALKEDLSDMQTATAEDIGKALVVAAVSNGKVTAWRFEKITGGDTGGVVLRSSDGSIYVNSSNQLMGVSN